MRYNEMKKSFTLQIWTGVLGAVAMLAGNARAQLPGPNVPAQTPVAIQLPLSGRAGQSGSVTATQAPVPGATSSVNTLNTSVQAQGPYSGSVPGAGRPFSGKLSLKEAIQRGLEYNLGQASLRQAVRQASGQSKVSRAALLPNLNGSLTEAVQQTNLRAFGIRLNSPVPGVSIPSVVGPFNYFDLRARLTQTVVNLTQWNNYRSSREMVESNEQSVRDARDLVVYAVGGAYLQVIAAKARVASQTAQLETANALFQQAQQLRGAGVLALTDLDRSQVQAMTERQRLITIENDLSKQKINLARLVGLAPNDQFDITDDVPFAQAPPLEMGAALNEAFLRRADLKAAEAQIRAAQHTRDAARAEHLPSLSVNADYGAIGTNPAQAHGTFSVVGTLSFPIWQGGRIEGDIEEADASLGQRRAELEDLRGRIEADVRNAFLDLQAAGTQVEVARQNIDVARETLTLTRQRLDVGVSTNVEVVQAQQSVASAELDYIDSVFAHNVAKLSLARALGAAADELPRFLKTQ
jgi:outer membrane protein TolC